MDYNIKIKNEDTFHHNDIISKCVAKVVNQIIKSNTDVKKIKTLRGLYKNNLNNMKAVKKLQMNRRHKIIILFYIINFEDTSYKFIFSFIPIFHIAKK